MRPIRPILLIIALAAAGCGRARQDASISLDEARLNIGAARKAGAEALSPMRLRAAEETLADAERRFAAGSFKASGLGATEAARLAAEAEAEAQALKASRPSVSKPKARPTRRRR